MASSSPNTRTTQTFYLVACLISYRLHGGKDVDECVVHLKLWSFLLVHCLRPKESDFFFSILSSLIFVNCAIALFYRVLISRPELSEISTMHTDQSFIITKHRKLVTAVCRLPSVLQVECLSHYCIRCYVMWWSLISVCVDINVINKCTNRNSSSEQLHWIKGSSVRCVVHVLTFLSNN